MDKSAVLSFMQQCQFKFGGIAKAPGETSDPYHTYLSLAALALQIPDPSSDASWKLEPLEPILNTRKVIEQWAKQKIALS
jgi:geranylgeranyl transferase type-1 subunit beta